MAKTKYKLYYQRMLEQNEELFNNFRELHNRYEQDPNNLQEEFNHQGEKILDTVREWENRLCMQSEKGGYSTFSPKLAEKFQEEVRKEFPMIDHIGLIVQSPSEDNGGFAIKRIKLF